MILKNNVDLKDLNDISYLHGQKLMQEKAYRWSVEVGVIWEQPQTLK